jgi:uncharacterized protein YecT (DUF1311 family)
MNALLWAATALIVTGTIAFAFLRAWRGWLDLRRFEIAQEQEARRGAVEPAPTVRIEMADLRERLRKLEAIATGVDL